MMKSMQRRFLQIPVACHTRTILMLLKHQHPTQQPSFYTKSLVLHSLHIHCPKLGGWPKHCVFGQNVLVKSTLHGLIDSCAIRPKHVIYVTKVVKN